MGEGFKSAGVQMIQRERARQVLEKGWTPAHDDAHEQGDLALFAGMLLSATLDGCGPEDVELPDGEGDWITPAVVHALEKWPEPVDRLRIVGALVAAEIDRLLRTRTAENAR